MIKFGSVCSGIEAASVAWHPLGWKAAWLSEIEPFPSAVLAHHYPNVPNLGDMTQLPELIKSGLVEAPDVFCGGTPCQAFSVAGLRKSLDDARGNLSLTFCEIANAIDSNRNLAGLASSIIFWENVPGVLSTADNAFGCFLGALAGEDEPIIPSGGKWTNAGCVYGPQRAVAWRVFDAQYFGVAQRRRRVFVVASARNDFDPAAVLFEFDGVRRDTAPSRETRQKPAGTLEASLGRSRGAGTPAAAIVEQPTYAIQGSMIGRNDQAGPQGDGINEEVCFTQNCVDRHAVAQPMVLMDQGGSVMNVNTDGTVGTLRRETHGHEPVVMQPVATFLQDDATPKTSTELAGTLRREAGGEGACVQRDMQVRRLTPVECERLQGFPDNYTNIPWRNKPESPDGPRYKALGNSWAVPVVRWIGQRIARHVDT